MKNTIFTLFVVAVTSIFLAACSSGSARNRIAGTSCKVNSKPIPAEVKNGNKVSMTSLQPVEGKLGLPVGKLVYRSIDFFSEIPSESALKVVSFRGLHSSNGAGKWKYESSCARLSPKDVVEDQEFMIPGKIEIASSGQLAFENLHVGVHSFKHKVGFKFELAQVVEDIDSFEKAFLLDNGRLEFYLLKEKFEGRPVYEMRSELTGQSSGRVLQFAIKFALFGADEEVPEDLLLRP